ncbi:MAG: helix-turn-helix domain-containing protein [Candidatus Methylacidiphilales bacterium]|nr:helix-turn-helix domain-containing protein [Candidatus Methylacidiphilales bacterium]
MKTTASDRSTLRKADPGLTRGAEAKQVVMGFCSGRHLAQPMHKPHMHQELEWNYLPRGSLVYLAGGRWVRVPERRLTVFWAAAPHQVIEVHTPEPFYWFTLPFAWFLQWGIPRNFTEALLGGRFMIDAVEDPCDALQIPRWHRDMRTAHPERLRIVELELEARLRRFVLGRRTPSTPERVGNPGPLSAVRQMAEEIARRYREPLTIAEIVRPTGLNPHYAMTLFRRTCAMSLLDYLIQHRIFHARRLLVTTPMKILDVALESGFGSLSRFNEAFVRANLCTPRDYRKNNLHPATVVEKKSRS